MRAVPKSRAGLVAFYRGRVDRWVERAADLGVSPEDAEAVRALAQEALDAAEAQHRAQTAARGATLRYNAAVRKLREQGGMLIQRIHGHAGPGGPDVYKAAALFPRRKKSPIGPPGVPYGLSTRLCATGALILKWRCDHPPGAEQTQYYLFRQLGGAGPFALLAIVGKKTYTDFTIPRGTADVTYRIHAKRSTGAGPTATFPVHFGGGMPATAHEARRLVG